MDASCSKQAKRQRKANFSDSHIQVLLEEIGLEHDVLFAANNLAVTNKRKNDIWARITAKINACGTVIRTTGEVKDKWRGLKGAVLNRQRGQSKTGGGPPERSTAFEDIILSIIGVDSNLYTGIEVEGTDSYQRECYTEATKNQTTETQEALPETPVRTTSARCSTVTTCIPAAESNTGSSGADQLTPTPSTITVALPTGAPSNSTAVDEEKDHVVASTSKELPNKTCLKRRKRFRCDSRRATPSDEEERALFAEYLNSEIRKNNAKAAVLELKRKLLERELQNE